jgi:hypothetical protein
MGRMKRAKRIRAFFLWFEKKGNKINSVADEIIKGAYGTQSWRSRYKMVRKEPVPSMWKGSMRD